MKRTFKALTLNGKIKYSETDRKHIRQLLDHVEQFNNGKLLITFEKDVPPKSKDQLKKYFAVLKEVELASGQDQESIDKLCRSMFLTEAVMMDEKAVPVTRSVKDLNMTEMSVYMERSFAFLSEFFGVDFTA